MNNYIKKCLLIYISLALVLFGMVGVTYAITATDADNYITRSQFAVDMAYLQNKLDEAEAGLMGNLNKYRATDVKFVTFDTPTKYQSDKYMEHNGGNFFPRYIDSASSTTYLIPTGGMTGEDIAGNDGKYKNYAIFRLYNGNYLITLIDLKSTSGSNEYFSYPVCAVPVENLPGYYLIIGFLSHYTKATRILFTLERLDMKKQLLTDAQIQAAGDLQIRFKKDLWQYCGAGATRLTTTAVSGTASCGKTEQGATSNPFLMNHWSGNLGKTAHNIPYSAYLDPDTNDYIVKLSNITSNTALGKSMLYGAQHIADFPLCYFIPKDNVEYLMAGLSDVTGDNTYGTGIKGFPPYAIMGTKTGADAYWEYEIVDCENGIQYFHARKKPATDGSTNFAAAWNYSIPIVY